MRRICRHLEIRRDAKLQHTTARIQRERTAVCPTQRPPSNLIGRVCVHRNCGDNSGADRRIFRHSDSRTTAEHRGRVSLWHRRDSVRPGPRPLRIRRTHLNLITRVLCQPSENRSRLGSVTTRGTPGASTALPMPHVVARYRRSCVRRGCPINSDTRGCHLRDSGCRRLAGGLWHIGDSHDERFAHR